MRTLQLYVTGSATATSAGSVVIPSAATIKAIQVNFLVDSITDGASVRLEFSKVPTNQIAVNGALDPFLEIGLYGNFVTSGLAQNGMAQMFPMSVPCRQGEIVYVHATVAGTATYFLNAILWF